MTSIVWKSRSWLIKMLAGKDLVSINLDIDRERDAAFVIPKGCNMLSHRTRVANWPVGYRVADPDASIHLTGAAFTATPASPEEP